MSVVGPRPVMRVSFEAYPNEVQKIIYNVIPGLTGIGSIIFRDEESLITDVKNNG
jgi:lipopolysaccharide/colanic/teichoic acid biosynthesis glycosyltransferase